MPVRRRCDICLRLSITRPRGRMVTRSTKLGDIGCGKLPGRALIRPWLLPLGVLLSLVLLAPAPALGASSLPSPDPSPQPAPAQAQASSSPAPDPISGGAGSYQSQQAPAPVPQPATTNTYTSTPAAGTGALTSTVGTAPTASGSTPTSSSEPTVRSQAVRSHAVRSQDVSPGPTTPASTRIRPTPGARAASSAKAPAAITGHPHKPQSPIRVPAGATAGTQAAISLLLARAKHLLIPAAGVVVASPGHPNGVLLLFGALALVALVVASLGLLRIIKLLGDGGYGRRTG